MTAAWIVVAVASFLLAALLGVVDAALLAAGHAATRPHLNDPERAHRALGLARVLAHLVTGTAVALGILSLGLRTAVAIPMVAVVLLIHVVVVEGAARSAGQARGPQLIARFAPSAFVIDLILQPVTVTGGLIEAALSRLLPPVDETGAQPTAGTERFRELVTAEADVSAAEAELLHGVFSLGDTEVGEIMVPRVDMLAIDTATPWSEMLDRVRASEHARFPVFEESLDNVVGILYAKDLLPGVIAGSEPAEHWRSLVRPAAFIPATKTIDQQLRDFKAQRTHIALVMDEYGGTQGLVTIEDILEEIVGEIHDEFDVDEPAVMQEEGQRYWVSGSLSLSDLSELVGSDFQREDLTTVGGLVYDAFGRVPRAGESRRIDGFRVVVERVRRRRVERVYLERVSPEEAA